MNWRNAGSMTWNGRQLSNAIFGAVAAIDFSYNADGIRTEKYYFNHETPSVHRVKYILDGTKILAEMCEDAVAGETRTLYYFYDEKGDVAGFEYNGSAYFYQKNMQGDVLRVCNEGGDIVAEYTYDAWGKVLSVTDVKGNAITSDTHVANLNPFRYRSYYYDTETGFYYLNSRYYDPEVGRFLNADGIVGANGGITGYNMFAYCNNNPVIYNDPNGNTSALYLDDRSSLGFRDPWRDAGGAGGVSVRSSIGIRPKIYVVESTFEGSLYDSHRNKTNPPAFRERALGISGGTVGLTIDDDKNIKLTFADIDAYLYKAGYYYDYFELEGTMVDVAVNSSIGTDGLLLNAQATMMSGYTSFHLGPLAIRLEGYLGGYGFSGGAFTEKGTGFSFLNGIGGGIYVKWDW